MSKKEEPEILSFSKEDIPLLKEALRETQRLTRLSNDSMIVKEDGDMEVHPTRASFLVQFGIQYCKVLVRKGLITIKQE